MTAGVIATQLTTPTSRAITVWAGHRDITEYVLWNSMYLEDSGTGSKSTSVLRILGQVPDFPEIYDQCELHAYSYTENSDLFRGFVRARTPIIEKPSFAAIELLADDIGGLLDDTFISLEPRPQESLQARIAYLWGKYSGSFLSTDLSQVASIGGTLPAQLFQGVTLRQAIEMTIAQAGDTSADYYVDPLGRLHVFTSESNDAPYGINADSPGAGEVAPESLVVEYDSGTYYNRVYVRGATPSGSGYFQNDSAIVAANGVVRTGVIDATDCTTQAMARTLAQMYLGRVATGKPRGRFTSIVDGWRAGQNVTVTSAKLGLSASYRIARVVTTVIHPERLTRRYEVEFGRSSAPRLSSDTASAPIAGTAVVGSILDNAGNILIGGDADSTTILNPAIRRYIQSGIFNGDFSLTPIAPDSDITPANALPFWTFNQSSGSSVTVVSESDSSAASGRSLVMRLSSGATDDIGYIEQIVPVNGSLARTYVYLPSVTITSGDTTNDIIVFASAQYLTKELADTGTGFDGGYTLSGLGANTTKDLQPVPNGAGLVPEDAYYLRFRIGLWRYTAATTDTGWIRIHEAKLASGGIQSVVAEGNDPDNYGYGAVYQNGGNMFVVANQGGSSGGTPELLLSGSSASNPYAYFGNITRLESAGFLSLPELVSYTGSGPFNNTDIGSASLVRFTGGTPDITGFNNGYKGRILIVINGNSSTMTIRHGSASSSAANQVLCPGGVDASVSASGMAVLYYDFTSARWRILSKT